MTGLAVASGPLVGGAVVDGLAWQWIFWLNVPVGLVAAPLALRLIPEARVPGQPARRPRRGAARPAGSSASSGRWSVASPPAGPASRCSAPPPSALLLLVGFVVWERRAAYPLLPPRLLRVRGFAAGNAAIFLTFAALFSAVFFYGQLLQVVMAESPLGAGVRLMAWTGTFLVFAPAAGALADRIGERPLITTGLTVQAAAMVWFATTVGTDLTYLDTLGPFIVGGFGVSLAIPCGQSAVVAAVADRDVATASGVNATMRELGGVLGIAVTVAVFGARGGFASPADFVDGFRGAVLTAAGLSALGAVAGLALPTRRGVADDPDTHSDRIRRIRHPRRSSSMTARMVTYTVKDGRADENTTYVREVMADLEARKTEGVTYSVYLLDDGVSFVHVVDEEGDGGKVQVSEAFQRFTATLVEDRCADTPQLRQMTLVGSYSG